MGRVWKAVWIPLVAGLPCVAAAITIGVVLGVRQRKKRSSRPSKSKDSHAQRALQLPKVELPPVDQLEHITSLAVLMQVTGSAAAAVQAAPHVRTITVTQQGPLLGHLPPPLLSFRHLTTLNLSGCTLVHLPFNVNRLAALQSLNVSRNALRSVPFEVGDLASLTSLDLSFNQLTHVPHHLGNLTGLTALNLMANHLYELPKAIGKLTNLRILGLKSNKLSALPPTFSRLCSLVELFITDNQLTTLPEGFGGGLTSLVKLQASFNALDHLPHDILSLPKLELMRVAVCKLPSLPPALNTPAATSSRISGASTVSSESATAASVPWPRLAWFSLGGNRACGDAPLPRPGLLQLQASEVDWGQGAAGAASSAGPSAAPAQAGGASAATAAAAAATAPTASGATPSAAAAAGASPATPSVPAAAAAPAAVAAPAAAPPLSVAAVAAAAAAAAAAPPSAGGRKLGDGASGEVLQGTLVATGEAVAVKLFRADVSPDGRTEEEVAIACAVDHPHLTRVKGIIPAAAASGQQPVLVMDLVHGRPMAAKPTSQHLLRCKWAPGTSFALPVLLSVARGVALALEYLHEHEICHGDVYAHNILLDPATHHTTLCDFGASFVYQPGEWFWQAMEVRAYGLFLSDLVDRLASDAPRPAVTALKALVHACVQPVPAARPTFSQLLSQLTAVSA